MKGTCSKEKLQLRSILRDETGTVQLDIFLTFLLGLLFSLAAPKSDLKQTLLKKYSFRIGVVYLFVVGVGIAVMAYIIDPAWMWMYWVDPKGIPLSHVVVIFGLIYPGCFLLGYLLAPHLDAAGWGWRIAALVFAFEIIFIASTLQTRLWRVGSFEQFASGETVKMLTLSPVSFTTLSIGLLIGMGIAIPGLIGLLLHLHRSSDE
jgi:hypothetical protein